MKEEEAAEEQHEARLNVLVVDIFWLHTLLHVMLCCDVLCHVQVCKITGRPASSIMPASSDGGPKASHAQPSLFQGNRLRGKGML
jgi:hypothetical protein